jgi:hypothetical protein
MLYHNNREERLMQIDLMFSKIKAHNNKEEEIQINNKILFLNRDQTNNNMFIQTLI